MKNLLVNMALLIISLILTMLLFEGGLRALGYENKFQYISYLGREKILDPLPGVSYVYPAYASFTQSWPSNPRGYFDTPSNTITYRINNYGFRDEDFSLIRNERLRIAFLGDSFCWGVGVKREDLFAEWIESHLNEQSILNRAYEVYNFCLGGYSTAHEAALYKYVVRYFRPDVLVVWFFLNDVNVPPDLFFRWKLVDGGDWIQDWRRRSRLADLAVAPINRMRNHRILLSRVNAAFEKGHQGHASLERSLNLMGRLSREDSVLPIIAIFPWLYNLNKEIYPFKKPHHVTRSLAEQAGFEVLDLLPYYEGKKAEDLWVYSTDQHPNEIGHEIAAQAMIDFLKLHLERQSDLLMAASEKRRQAPPVLSDTMPTREWYLRFADLIESSI